MELVVGKLEIEVGNWNLKSEIYIQIIINFELEVGIGNWYW